MSCKHEMPLDNNGVCTGCGMGITDILLEHRIIRRPQYCIHDWKIYTGFTKVFEYCEHCDEKRPYVEPLVEEPPKPDFKTFSDTGLTPGKIRKGLSFKSEWMDVQDCMRYITRTRTVKLRP